VQQEYSGIAARGLVWTLALLQTSAAALL